MLERENGTYRNTAETDFFLDPQKPSYIGGLLEMLDGRLYGFWGSLTEALQTGELQNEGKQGHDFFKALYADPARLRAFLGAMSGLSAGAAHVMAAKFPWKDYSTFADVGVAQGLVSVILARAHPHLRGIGFRPSTSPTGFRGVRRGPEAIGSAAVCGGRLLYRHVAECRRRNHGSYFARLGHRREEDTT